MDPSDAKDAAKLFSVPDFVGDACKAIASRVRGAMVYTRYTCVCKQAYGCLYISVCMFVFTVCVFMFVFTMCYVLYSMFI